MRHSREDFETTRRRRALPELEQRLHSAKESEHKPKPAAAAKVPTMRGLETA